MALVVLISAAVFSAAPGSFPSGKITVNIPRGTGVSGIADLLKQKGIIKSAFMYKLYVVLLHDGKGVQAGDYLFDRPQSSLRVAYRTAYGIQGLTKIKITVPEGLASRDIGRLMARYIPGFDEKKFATLARPLEGKLFPDTYFFYENATPEQVVYAMNSNFESQISSLPFQSALFGKSLDKILVMASIVEEEANNSEDRRKISGVLWKRLDAGMALQVDAPFFYIFGKTSSQLSVTDLATSSPYNTYNHVGLPPAPISNPGLDSIRAALDPEKTPYWFYLADSKGITHYAVDHEGHLANKVKYLY